MAHSVAGLHSRGLHTKLNYFEGAATQENSNLGSKLIHLMCNFTGQNELSF